MKDYLTFLFLKRKPVRNSALLYSRSIQINKLNAWAPHHAHGVPCCGDDDVGAGDNAGARILERRLDVVDQIVAEEAVVLQRRLLRVGPVQQERRVAPL